VQISETKVLENGSPTLARAIGHHVKVFLEVLNEISVGVDELSAGVGDEDGRIVVQDIDGALQKIGTDQIIGRGPARIPPLRAQNSGESFLRLQGFAGCEILTRLSLAAYARHISSLPSWKRYR